MDDFMTTRYCKQCDQGMVFMPILGEVPQDYCSNTCYEKFNKGIDQGVKSENNS